MQCLICYKKAVVTAYGNSYCMKCYRKSPYYAEKKAKEDIKHDKENKQG